MHCDLIDLGVMRCADADAVQRRVVEEVRDGARPHTLLLVEHPPVITLGRRSRESNVLVAPDQLARLGVEVFPVDRGGDVTFHGPGQVVGYPIVALDRVRRDVKDYVTRIEETMIRVSASYGVPAGRIPGCTGAWVGRDKIGAIGVRLDRWITRHGFAYNVSVNLDYFRLIIPCGIADKGVTSLARLGVEAPMPEVKSRIADAFAEVFEFSMRSLQWA